MAISMFATTAVNGQWTSSRPDGHAPIGVMGDHMHEKGEVMLSARYMFMDMAGSRIGTDGVTDASVVDPAGSNFTITPIEMPMQMAMLGAMYAPGDMLTLMVMAPYLDISMDHITRAGGAFTTTSSGIGDVRLGGMVRLVNFGRQTLIANAFASLPTGSIDELDVLPISAGAEVQLPYPMQTGSGTFDLMPGITYLGQADAVSWGGQAMATIRTGTNDRDYTLGNRYEGTFWGGYRFNDKFSGSLRLKATDTQNIEGADPAPSVNPLAVPTARTDLRGGTQVDIGVGFNVSVPRSRGLRFAVEALLPIYRDLDGPQLETDLTLVFGVQIVPVQ